MDTFTPDHVAEAAKHYIALGYPVVPVPFEEKGSRTKDWSNLRITNDDVEQYFAPDQPMNIAILTGTPSGLVDVDLDSPEAIALAPMFLPETGMIFGHASKRRSHWMYRSSISKGVMTFKVTGPRAVAGAEETQTDTDTEIEAQGTDKGTMLWAQGARRS
jgi:hypothetical protein